MNLTDAATLYSYQAPALIAWIIGCTTAEVCNLGFIFVVYRSEKFRTKSNFVVCSLCVAEIFESLAWTSSAIKRLIYYSYNYAESTSQAACTGETMPINALPRIVECAAIALSLDRFLAVTAPVFYQSISAKRYVLVVNALCIGIGLLLGLSAFLDVDPRKVLVVCTFATANSAKYQSIQYVVEEVQTCMAAALDLSTLIVLWRRVYAIRRLPTVTMQHEERKKLEMGTFRTLLVIAVLYIVTYVFSTMYSSIILNFDNEARVRYAPVATLFPIANSASHLFVYLLMSKTFRAEFKKVFGRDKTSVTLTNSVATVQTINVRSAIA